jgi:tRNA-dihydrouridine synthase
VDFREKFEEALTGTAPILALAPMQEVTDWAFWKLMTRYGGADVYYTEYFRVYAGSQLDRTILKSIEENPTNRPVVAQMIGNDIPSLVRTARELQALPVVAVDLNLGCPAPIVYRKCAGGGLLRELERVDAILGALRDAVSIKFTVKTRLGFDSPDVFERLLALFVKHAPDLVTVHARTVKEMYRSEVHYEYIRQTVETLRCPVLANGNIYSAQKAEAVLAQTGARGLMIGRGAIRNPWLFQQIRDHLGGRAVEVPRGREVLEYIKRLWEHSIRPETREASQVMHMKRFMNFIGLGVDAEGEFLHAIRRVRTEVEFFAVCEAFLNHDRLVPLEPFSLALKESDLLAGEHR